MRREAHILAVLVALATAIVLAHAPSSSDAPPSPTDATTGDEVQTVPLDEALIVRAGATCLEHERLVTQIRTWFERERIDARLVVEVTGDTQHPDRLAFTLRRGEQVIAVRRFDPAPERCADLHAVVGLAIALAIDATLLDSVAGDPRLPKRPPDPPPREPEIEPPEPAPPRRRPPRRWQLWAELGALLTIGVPPVVGGGGRFGLRTSWRRIVDVGAEVLAMSSGQQPVGEGRALLSAAAGRVDLCAGPPWARVRPRGCVGVLAGAAFASAQGFDRDSNVRVPWVAIPFGIDLEVRLAPRVGLVLGLDGVPTVMRPTFEATDEAGARSVRRFARFGALVELGLVVRLW